MQSETNGVTTNHAKLKIWLIGLIFILALLPRVVSLNAFLTADEDDQLSFSAQFLSAVQQQDWAGALILGYPGVPTLSAGAFGLWLNEQISQVSPLQAQPEQISSIEAVDGAHKLYLPLVIAPPPPPPKALLTRVQESPLDYIVAVRLPMAIMAALMITLTFIFLWQLVTPPVAVLAVLLIAFEPMFLANSRIIHVDAPLTYFMFASFLAFLIFLRHGNWGWLVASGILGGLAVLSKIPGAVLGPILLISGFLYVWFSPLEINRRDAMRRFVIALLGWGVIALLAFFALWPSMWARPMVAINGIISTVKWALSNPHPSRGIFEGALGSDQTPWYYLVALPFHLSALTSLGSLLSVGVLVSGFRDWRRKQTSYFSQNLPLILAQFAFIIIFGITASIVARRGVRYLLPVFPAFSLLAALGLWSLTHWFKQRWLGWAVTIAVAGQIILILSYHPYYFTYFNPLLGGAKTAPDYVVIGWGEGLERAAEYLNAKPDAEDDTVAAWYSWQFENYYRGHSLDLASNEPAFYADYTIFYINQLQRGFPSAELLAYFADRQPEKIITLNGLDYAWIYPGPIIGNTPPLKMSQPLNLPLNEAITLLGLNLPDEAAPAMPITIFWQATGPLPPDLNVSLRAVDADGTVWGQTDRLPIGGLVRTDKWQAGQVIRDEYLLNLDPALPPGAYSFEILLYNFETGEIFAEAKGVDSLTISEPFENQNMAELSLPHKTDQTLAKELTLLGHTFSAETMRPGWPEDIKLYWQATAQPKRNYSVNFIAQAEDGTEIVLLTEYIGPADFLTGAWQKGQILAQSHRFAFPADAPPGNYHLGLEVEPAQRLWLGEVNLQAHEHSFTLPENIRPIGAAFGSPSEISLAGYTAEIANDTLHLKLYWQSSALIVDDYRVFVHLTDADGAIVAQRDFRPGDGDRPTPSWLPGEVISDSIALPFPAGDVSLWLGLYNPATGERLPVQSDSATVEDNRLQLMIK